MELIIWIVFGISAAIVADAKGRNVGLWIFFGVLFGVFALIVVAVLPKLKKCPQCMKGANIQARICPSCQHSFETKHYSI